MKAFIAFALLICTAVDAQAASWSDLWLNRDQQAQRLLEAGKPAEAARIFADARHRAYAQIQAGQYEDAAKQLQAFDDAESHYNRGNALARGGNLDEALAAYDRAIEQAPADSALSRDAHHNRDLVRQQLRKQSQQSASSGAGKQSQPAGDAAKDQQQKSGQSGTQHRSGESSDGNSAGSSQPQSAQNDSQPQDSQGKPEAQQQASAQQRADSATSSSQSQPGSETKSQDAAQARRDAEASLAQDKQSSGEQHSAIAGNTAPSERDEDAKGQPVPADEPPSEQALALDQWLRQIPDDPSGLLRRKFLIEHLRRQRESQR